MSWTCQCTAAQPDDSKFCDHCGQPKPNRPVPAQVPANNAVLKLAAVAGVLVVGGIFGTVVAVTAFGGRSGQAGSPASATASSHSDPKSAYQQAFETTFKTSCRQAAMRSGSVSRTAADNYCDCALPVFQQTHDMGKVIASCKKYVMR